MTTKGYSIINSKGINTFNKRNELTDHLDSWCLRILFSTKDFHCVHLYRNLSIHPPANS